MHDTPADLDPVEASLLTAIGALSVDRSPTIDDATGLSAVDPATVALWLEAQITSRLLDHGGRWLRREHGLGYYTIGSAGHESNAVVASALRPTDPALLHYRSGGFYVARALMTPSAEGRPHDPVADVLRGMLAKSSEPIAGGRHKVFGHRDLSIVPQTSTIASHLPRAVGLALSFGLVPEAPMTWPADSVVVCSFGDASLNHSTAQGALNWAGHAHRQGHRVPILFVCEDNGLGLSVPSPTGWVRSSLEARADLRVAAADGADPLDVWQTTTALVTEIRHQGVPGVLHLSTVRFLGHAGTDVESAYRDRNEIAADAERDPIIGVAAAAAALGVSSPAETIEWYLDERETIRATALDIAREPELLSAAEIMAPLTASAERPTAATLVSPIAPASPPTSAERSDDTAPLTLALTINRALSDALEESGDTLVFGEDVGVKGGAYGVTRGLHKRFGSGRVFDTLLDEQSILGLALGIGLNGRLPIPEIQYLAYAHNAEDQLRGEAATLAFFSQRQYLNPMVVRIAGYAYQRGFGGHFHNDNSIAVFRDIPGITIASPSHPSDAAGMLHACIDHARSTGAVCISLEPIARYHHADLHADGDGGWTARYDPTPVPIGRARLHRSPLEATVTIVTFGNGVFLSLQAQRRLADEHAVAVDVVDLRWIAPLPVDDMMTMSAPTSRVLVVDETRRTGGVGEGIVTELVDAGFDGPISRVSARDSFVPLGKAANLVLVSVDEIVEAAIAVAQLESSRAGDPRPGNPA